MLQLTVNGTPRSFDGDPTMPLLWFLRDELGLTGTRYGCGIAQCGACTVHVNGAPVRACQRRMSTLAGATVTTIEGLHPSGEHPLQVAWRHVDVPQCGFCQSGQIMQAATLLARTRQPTDADIEAAMNGHLCRCGTYPRIRAAITQAAEQMRAAQPGEGAP
jgi:isoquinoline 1-oxidoreductase alpha subunit